MKPRNLVVLGGVVAAGTIAATVQGQLIDKTRAPNAAGSGVGRSLEDQIGAGRGDVNTVNSSLFLINRDPARSIRRGRQLFQRKFHVGAGFGPLTGDGSGDIASDASIGAGLVDSCAGCHGRPRGSAGHGGNVNTRPDSRDAPHLLGLGLHEQLGDEITKDLRAIRDAAVKQAKKRKRRVKAKLKSKGIRYGSITAHPDGTVDTSRVEGVNADLRVRPFFAQGGTISMREFMVGAFNAEMGLESPDPDLLEASSGGKVVTPSGMVLDGSIDSIEAPPVSSESEDSDGDGVTNEIPTSIVDNFEFYLLNYFKPGTGRSTIESLLGRVVMNQIGCTDCHKANLTVDHDRRVADVETVHDPVNGIFNNLFATASLRLVALDEDDSGFPPETDPSLEPFVVRNFFADLKRHDVGAGFYEIQYDNSINTEFMTEPLWGVGTTAPYGHDGRSINLEEVILRHGGEAQKARDRYAKLPDYGKAWISSFLQTLIIFPPDDTASNLNPGDRDDPDFPQRGHGSINLGALFTTDLGPE